MNKTDTFQKILQEFNSQEEKDISYLAQFEIEHSCADAIRETAPFSKERQDVTKLGYETVDRIISLRAEKEGTNLQAYGANEACFSLLDQLLTQYISSRPKDSCDPIRFFEGGVGTGAVLKHLAEHFNGTVSLSGCDVYLDRAHLGSLQDRCVEDTLYHSLLSLPDESIDVYYWNDVMEHMPEDEMPSLLQLLNQKLAHNGILITVTPPAGIGPHDITYFVDPYAKKALGLHLHEYYFYEIYEMMEKINLQPYAFAKKQQNDYQICYDGVGKRYQRHSSAEQFRLHFAYLFPGKPGYFWRRALMHSFTDATVFIKNQGR